MTVRTKKLCEFVADLLSSHNGEIVREIMALFKPDVNKNSPSFVREGRHFPKEAEVFASVSGTTRSAGCLSSEGQGRSTDRNELHQHLMEPWLRLPLRVAVLTSKRKQYTSALDIVNPVYS